MSVALAYAICALVWGTTWFAIRVTIVGEGAYPTFESAALRFTIAAVVLGAIAWAGFSRPGPRSRRQWVWLGIAGALNALGYGLVYKGEETVSGGLAAVLFGTMPLFTALLATITRTERIERHRILGALVALAGISVVFWDRIAVSVEQAMGLAVIMLAVAVSAGYSVILKREQREEIHPLAANGVFLTVTAVVLWMFCLARGVEPIPWPPKVEPTIALVYLGVFGSVVVFASYIYLLKRTSLMTTMTLVFIQPTIALFVDALWEQEVRLVTRTYVGCAITLSGVFISVKLWPHLARAARWRWRPAPR
jgi:drug/metabolite transporter (DMT)-like permease